MKSSRAIAHPNFALIKYWGKSNIVSNIPAMDSLAITLNTMRSETRVSFPDYLKQDTWILNGMEQNSLGQLCIFSIFSKTSVLYIFLLANSTINFDGDTLLVNK